MTDMALLSLGVLSRAIERREISPVDLVRRYLDRIAALDERLHSFNCLRADAAMAEAREAEAAIGQGERRGPLHGIPIGIKDMIDVAGLPTTAQAVHRRDAVAREDAAVVAALRRAGAIILGKQAMSEYAVGGTQVDHAWPPARNPWNLELDALSSSSGSCVSVAAGLCAGSVGTETAGSIRDPSAWNGVAGLNPTVGLISRQGVLPLSQTMDSVGPIAWTVEDCALMLDGMMAPDAPRRPGLALPGPGLAGLRIGVVRHYFENDPGYDRPVLMAMEHSLRLLSGLGARLSDVRLGDFERYGDMARAISWPEEYAAHREELDAFPERLTPVSRARLMDGKAYSAADYIAALEQRRRALADYAAIMADVDLLVLPTMKKPAQKLGFEFTDLGKVELSLSRPFNLLGVPALALCNGFTELGLPLSMQIVGRHFEDDLVLRAGHALETALGLRQRRPPIALVA